MEDAKMTTKQKKAEDRQRALDTLHRMITPGMTVHTILRHVSKSGAVRDISVVVILPNNTGRPTVFHPNWAVATLLGDRLTDKNGSDAVRVSGGGMDMGFDLIYRLSSAMFNGDGYQLNQEWL